MEKTKQFPDPQRHFYAYFFISIFILFIFIASVQYIFTMWLIKQYESERIMSTLYDIRHKIVEGENAHRDIMSSLKNTYRTQIELKYSPRRAVNALLPPQSMFYVLDSDFQLVFGDAWVEFITLISDKAEYKPAFLFGDEYTVYQVSADNFTDPLTDQTEHYFYISRYTPPLLPQIFFHTLTNEQFKIHSDKYISTVYKNFTTHALSSEQPHQSEFEIEKIDSLVSCGIYSQFDLNGTPLIVHIFPFYREMYSVLTRYFIFVCCTVLLALIVICWLFYSFINKRVFAPLQHMILQMQDISVHPDHIAPIATQNEIFAFFSYFNEMLNAIEHYRTQMLHHEKIKTHLEMELVRINKLSELGKRIEGVVHNLNTPLNSVIGYAQLLENEVTELYTTLNIESESKQDIQKIISNAKSMSDIIKQLLYKTRDDSFSMPQTIQINSLIKQELDFCQHNLFFKHNVMLSTNLAPDLPEIDIVYGDISQVFQSVFNNAIDAMAHSTEKILTVTSWYTDGFVVFTIQDTGIGMSDEVKEHIFETGFTTKTQTESSGFGIGLALSKMIMDKVGGWIRVSSATGMGTSVSIGIPMGS